MAEETKYIPYGLDEISQLELQTALANDLPNFMNKYKWLLKPKNLEKFLKAYDDIMKGFTGATNEGGRWSINTSNVINTESMSPKDREIYEHAAYYIQLQMAKITPRKKEEEKKKENLEKFNFYDSFNKKLLDDYYGGQSSLFSDSEQGWNSLDNRDKKTGLRGIDKRRNRMIEALTNYSNSLKDNYNFEGTSFSDINDAKNKIQRAIEALKTTDNTLDDLDAFNALGLLYRSYFSNGGNENSGYADSNGNPLTWELYSKYQLQLSEIKAKLAKQNTYNNTLFINRVTNPKMNGRNAQLLKEKYKDSNSLLSALLTYSQKDIRTLTPDEQSEVVGAYRRLANLPIDNKLLHQLQSSSSGLYKNAAPNRFKKIQGIDNLIWDSVAGQIIQINTRQQLLNILNLPLDLFAGVKTLLELLETPISKEGWTSADSADVVSMIGDLVSLGGLWANIGGTATSLTADIYSDYTRGKNTWDILKGVGANLGWGLAGMLPGAKSTKLVARAARLVPKAFMLAQSAGIVMDPEVQKSAMKFTTTEGLKTASSKDLENLKYLFHAVTGGTNIAKSHFRAKNYREQINKLKVQTKEGSKNLSNKDIAEINKAGRKGGQKAAESKFKEKTGQEAVEGQFKFSENGRSRFNPIRYSSNLNKFFGTDLQLKGQQTTDLRAVSLILLKDRELPWYNWNKGYATFELTPFRSNPPIKLEKTKQNTNNLQSSLTLSTILSKWSEIEKGPKKWSQSTEAKEYRKMLKGNYSSNAILGGTHKIGDMTIDVDIPRLGATNGFAEITFSNGNKQTIKFNTQKLLQESIAKIIKERRVQVDSSGKKTKVDAKEISKILKSLKARGFLKQGGQINSSLDKIIEDFIKNNNI